MAERKQYSWRGLMSQETLEPYQCRDDEPDMGDWPSSMDPKKDPHALNKFVVSAEGLTPPNTIDRRVQLTRKRQLPRTPSPTTGAAMWAREKIGDEDRGRQDFANSKSGLPQSGTARR